MIKFVDKRCMECSSIMEYVDDETVHTCEICGSPAKRIYNVRKYNEYPEGHYEHMDDGNGPVYIKDREHFWKECKKRGLEPVGDKVAKKQKNAKKQYF